MKKLENIRTDYKLGELHKSSLVYSPVDQFKLWFNQVIHEIEEPTAMTLSTYDQKNGIQNRVVLLKEIKKDSFVFYTNYNSLKAKQIDVNPNVSLCFFWPKFQRQVRVNGVASKISMKRAVAYFKKRPRKSQIAAWASSQSNILENRESLENKFQILEQKFKDKLIPKPYYWGGYDICPMTVEFWQGRENRMHDRFLYKKKNNKWLISRISP